MTQRRGPLVAVLAALVALALTAVSGVPAYATDDISLSRDGRTWSDTLRTPLFDPDFRWVPGDREVESFYVRNDGPTDASVTIEVRTKDGDDLLATDDVALSARVAGGAWVPLVNGRPSKVLADRTLDSSGSVRVDVAVEFFWESSNATQHAEMPLDFVVILTGDDPDDGDGEGGGGGDGELPTTGSDVSPLWLWLAAVLIGGGLAVLTVRRREIRRG